MHPVVGVQVVPSRALRQGFNLNNVKVLYFYTLVGAELHKVCKFF